MKLMDAEYGYDKDLAKGNWFTVGGLRVKLAYMQEATVEAKVKELRDTKEKQLKRKLNEDEHEEIGTEVFVEHVLLDWEDDEECNEETKAKVLKGYPQFISDCVDIANNNKMFQAKKIEETVGK